MKPMKKSGILFPVVMIIACIFGVIAGMLSLYMNLYKVASYSAFDGFD